MASHDGEVLRSAVLRYFACLNAEDWDGMAALWTDDASLRAVGARPRTGRAEVLEYFGKLFEPWREHVDEPTRLVVAADAGVVTADVEFRGVSADGRAVRFDAVDVFDFADGRICRLSNWYDLVLVRRALSGATRT